jgi:hypothetical protein
MRSALMLGLKNGSLSDQTQSELELFDMPELAGKKAALIAQGFLT